MKKISDGRPASASTTKNQFEYAQKKDTSLFYDEVSQTAQTAPYRENRKIFIHKYKDLFFF